MAWFVGQSAVMMLLAFLLGLLVGWLIWARRQRAVEIERAADTPTAETPNPAETSTTASAPEPAVALTPAPGMTTNGSGPSVGGPAHQTPAHQTPAHQSPVHQTPHIPSPRAEVVTPSTIGRDISAASNRFDLADTIGMVFDGSVADALAAMSRFDTYDTDHPNDPNDTNDTSDTDDKGTTVGAADQPVTDPNATNQSATDQSATDQTVADQPVTDPTATNQSPTDQTATDQTAADQTVADELALVEAAAALPSIDNLERIEGIGPKFAAALVAGGIRTFDQLAAADEARLRNAINDAGYDFAPSIGTWARQARLLAAGDETGFEQLIAQLIAGRNVRAAGQADAGTRAEAGGDLPAPEDLARIEGIGPRFAGALVAAGIRTFAQLADSDQATLRKALADSGLRFAPSLPTWAEQARLLADGNEDAFAELTARLIAGRAVTDDLERIEGIGPKIAAALRGAGIRTYRSLANSDSVALRNAVQGAGLTFAPSLHTWSRQARLLADGDEEGFADLTRRLIAGRDEGLA